MSLFLAALMCVTTLAGFGTTVYAAEETDEVYLVSFPRDGDDNYSREWGHGSHEFMNGWSTDGSRYTSVYAMGSYTGNICYCIEPGVALKTGDRFTKKGENFWDNYPSSYNKTISPDDIKLFIGRIISLQNCISVKTGFQRIQRKHCIGFGNRSGRKTGMRSISLEKCCCSERKRIGMQKPALSF